MNPRTNTPTPFAEGTRNADLLTARSFPTLALDLARAVGRFDELCDLLTRAATPGSRWSDEACCDLYARALVVLRELDGLRTELGEDADVESDECLRDDLRRAAGRHGAMLRRMYEEEAA